MAYWIPGFSGGRNSQGRPRLMVLSRRSFLVTTLQAVVSLAACTAPPPAPLVSPLPSPANDQGASSASGTPRAPLWPSGACARSLPTVVPPTPLPYPGYAQQEPETGLHVVGPAQTVDLASYRLTVSGLTQQPLSLTYGELRCLPKVGARVTLDCPGFFVDESNLAGTTLATVIALAGPQQHAALVTLTSIEGYEHPFSLADAQAEGNFLAYEWEGEPLPASHGFPLRAVFPGKAGSAWVKWVTEIKLS